MVTSVEPSACTLEGQLLDMPLVYDSDGGRSKDLPKFGESGKDLWMVRDRKRAHLLFKVRDLFSGPCADPDIVGVSKIYWERRVVRICQFSERGCSDVGRRVWIQGGDVVGELHHCRVSYVRDCGVFAPADHVELCVGFSTEGAGERFGVGLWDTLDRLGAVVYPIIDQAGDLCSFGV